MTRDPERARQEWLAKLIVEFRQVEQSAIEHPPLEADRLGDVPPAHAMRAIAADATVALATFDSIADGITVPEGDGGEVLGTGLSVMRKHLIDKLVSNEASYRGTIIGMTHGLDCGITLQGVAARTPGAQPLADWLATWIPKRRSLIEGCREALSWFHDHPDIAQRPAEDGALARGARAVARGASRLVR